MVGGGSAALLPPTCCHPYGGNSYHQCTPRGRATSHKNQSLEMHVRSWPRLGLVPKPTT